MAYSKVQTTAKVASSSTSLTITLASTPTIGNAVIVCLSNSAEPIISVTDNQGNTYKPAIQRDFFSAGNAVLSIFFCKSITATGSPFSITATIASGSRNLTGFAIELGGTGGNLYVDRTAFSGSNQLATIDTGSTYVLDTAGDAFVVAGVYTTQVQTSITVESVSPAWTQDMESLGGSPFSPCEFDSRIITPANGTVQKCSWTLSTGSGTLSTAVIVAFRTDVPTGLIKVQSAGRTASVSSLTFTSPPTIGNAIVVAVFNFNNILTGTVTDNWGNKYFQDVAVFNGQGCAIFSCPAITVTGSPFTVSVSGASFTNCIIIEVANATGGLYPDRVGTGTGSGTAQSTTVTAALRANKVFVIAVAALSNAGAFLTVGSVSPPWFEEWDQVTGGSAAGEIDTRILNGVVGTTQNISWTSANSGNWAAALVAYASGSDLPIAEARVTQDVIEIVIVPVVPELRVSQVVAETLTSLVAIPELRVSQVAVEILTGAVVVATVTETTRFQIILP